jgi:hypothetical protein
MPVAPVILRVVNLGLSADVDGLWVELMQVKEECEVVIYVLMRRVYFDASPPMFDCWVVQLQFEIGEAEVIMKLCVFSVQRFSLFKCLY